MASVILAIAIIVGLIWWTQRRRVGRRWRFGRGRSTSAAHSVPRRLRQELIRIAGNAQVAERLVNNLRLKHPEQSERWYWEKAIFDLERDRHY